MFAMVNSANIHVLSIEVFTIHILVLSTWHKSWNTVPLNTKETLMEDWEILIIFYNIVSRHNLLWISFKNFSKVVTGSHKKTDEFPYQYISNLRIVANEECGSRFESN